MPEPLRLLGEVYWISPYVFSCFVALREKGLPFEVRSLRLHEGEQRAGTFQEASITEKVPVLEHGACRVAESSAIVEYLEEAFPAPDFPALLPTKLGDRARARQLMAWIRSDLLALREERPTTTMFYAHAKTPLSEAGRAAAEKLVRVAGRVIAEGATSLFETWSIADADLAFALHRLVLNGHALPQKIQAFAETQWLRPSVREFVSHERPRELWPEAPDLP